MPISINTGLYTPLIIDKITILQSKPDSLSPGTDDSIRGIERRLRPSCLGCDPAHLPNPFTKIRVISTEQLRPAIGDSAELFFDCARRRRIKSAMATLRSPQRQAVAAVDDPDKVPRRPLGPLA